MSDAPGKRVQAPSALESTRTNSSSAGNGSGAVVPAQVASQLPCYDCFVLDPLAGKVMHSGRLKLIRLVTVGLVLGPWLLCAIGAAVGHRFGSVDDTGSGLMDFLYGFLGQPRLASPVEMTFMRDVGSQAYLILLGLSTWVIMWQWDLLRAYIPDSVSNKVLIPKDEEAAKKAIDEANHFLGTIERYVRLPIGAIVLIGVGMLAQVEARDGVFEMLASPDYDSSTSSWKSEMYRGWWAGNSNLTGTMTLVIASSFAFYFIVLENIAGMRAAWLILQGRRQRLWTYDVNTDLDFAKGGWDPIRKVFASIAILMLLHGLTLILVIVAVSRSRTPYALVVLAIFALVNPTYFILGSMEALSIRSSRKRLVTQLVSQQVEGTRSKNLSEDQLTRIRSRLSSLERIGPLPFRIRGIVVLFAAYILPTTLGIISIVVSVR